MNDRADNPLYCRVHPWFWGDILHWRMAYCQNNWPLETPEQWADLYQRLVVCEKDAEHGGEVWRAIDYVLSISSVQDACIAKGYLSPFD